MKKYLKILFVLIVFVAVFQTGCSKKQHLNTADWENIIRTDFFSGKSTVEKAIEEAVTVNVEQNENRLIVTVKAPDICDELLKWMESISDEEFSEEELEKKILHLLKKSEKHEFDFEMNWSMYDDTVKIEYTAEFAETMYCGLSRFYAEVTQRILEEMEDKK